VYDSSFELQVQVAYGPAVGVSDPHVVAMFAAVRTTLQACAA